jgi:hypothetical protein
MDSSDGRNDVKTPPVVFTVPYSGFEILLLSDSKGRSLGIVYHPMKMDDPITWHSDCPHCLRGKQLDLDLSVKRSIQILMSRRSQGESEEYTIPTNGQPSKILLKRNEKSLLLQVIQNEEAPIEAMWEKGRLKSSHKNLLLRSKILDRSLRLIASLKTPSLRSAKSTLMPMLIKQQKEGISTQRRFPCYKIDWASVVLEL